MKRLYSFFMALGLLIALTLPASGADGRAVSITVDGVPLDSGAAYITEDGTTMVPLRALSEALGFTVTWDQESRTAAVTSPGGPGQPGDGEAASPLVVLDPGHGGSADGAKYDGIAEKDLNLSIALQAARLLEAEGVSVLMTRSADQDIGLYERTDLANGQRAALFVSVHCNASVTNPEAAGIYTAAYGEDTPGWRLAETLRQTMMAATGAGDMGTEARPNLAVLRTAQMPAALVECGYMSTPGELALLVQPDYQAKLAQGIADGILTFLTQAQ